MRQVLVLVLLALLLGACRTKPASFSPAGASPSKLIVTPGTALVGKVVRVNAVGRFVVLNFPIGRLPYLEQRLSVYRLGLRIGELKVTGPQQDDLIVANLVEGDAAPGDEVRSQ